MTGQPTDFISFPNISPDSLTTDQAAIYKHYEDSKYTQTIQIVSVASPFVAQNNGQLRVKTAPNTTASSFKARHVSQNVNSEEAWSGELFKLRGVTVDSNAGHYGFLIAMDTGDGVFGEFNLDSLHYQIKNLGGGLAILIELKKDAAWSECDMTGTTEVVDEAPEDRSLCPVRVLVLYTEAAKALAPDVEDIAYLAIEETRTALLSSDVTNSELFIQLAGVLPLTNAQFQESFDINQDRSNISTDSDILGFRDATYADIVIIMTYDGYTSSATGAVSAIGEDETFVNKAFALVLVNFANAPTYTFAHEVAHLFGAHHETIDNCAQDGDDSGRAFAHGYLTPDLPLSFPRKQFRTIMFVCTSVQAIHPRIPYYSNPDVKYKTRKLGTEDTNYNARVLRDEACRVADYVDDPPQDPFVAIDGALFACADGSTNTCLTAEFHSITGPYVYQWQKSTDGVNWGNVVSTQATYCPSVPTVDGAVVFLRLTAGTVNGPSFIAYHDILVEEWGPHCD